MADLNKLAELLEAVADELKDAMRSEIELLGQRSGRPMPTIGAGGGQSMEDVFADDPPYTQEELQQNLDELDEATRTENRRETAAKRVAQLLPLVAKGVKMVVDAAI